MLLHHKENEMEKNWEVVFQVYAYIKAETKEEAIAKFMEENNVKDELKIYITAEEDGN